MQMHSLIFGFFWKNPSKDKKCKLSNWFLQIDKNFEKYSDVVNEEKETGIDSVVQNRLFTLSPSASKISNLEISVVRSEDPLVAIKVCRLFLRIIFIFYAVKWLF